MWNNVKAWIEVENGTELIVTQFLDPARAHEAQQELEYQNGLIARVVRRVDKLSDDGLLYLLKE